MYDSVATLKQYGAPTYDAAGNETTPITEVDVFVMPRSVYSSEFYAAAQLGLHPSITFEMANRADYNGQKIIEFEGRDYTVIRADWDAQKDKLKLICEERVVNG